MRFFRKLQAKLTLSHLIVTVASVVLVEILFLAGYWLYLRTDLVARWAGEMALGIANEIAYVMEGDPLTPADARDFVLSSGLAAMLDQQEDIQLDRYDADWLVIVDPNGRILASNDQRYFAPGQAAEAGQLPNYRSGTDADFEYSVAGEHHIGQAPIISYNGTYLGWVYYRAAYGAVPYTSTETILALVGLLLGAAAVAVVASGAIGWLLALSFGRRLERLGVASAALAAGDLQQRVPAGDGDEIDQLGQQFNLMADQLSARMLELHNLAERNALLAEEARALAAIEERNRLARELHDAVKQQLFALSLSANSVRQLLTRDPDLAAERLAQLEQQSRDIHLEMDSIIQQLRPASLADQGLAEALRLLVERWQAQHGIAAELNIQGEREIPLQAEQALYRVVQEALNNIVRHAKASRVQLRLHYQPPPGGVALNIGDNGRGFSVNEALPADAFGLQGMRQRITELGGQFELQSAVGRGTLIQIQVPV